MMLRTLCVGVAVVWLGGCQYLPEQIVTGTENETVSADSCQALIPSFEEDACLVPSWVGFGLSSQRGDDEWRRQTLEGLDTAPNKSEAERQLIRAVVHSWGSEREWAEAAELYRTYTHAAPAGLQPLLLYWRNELEGRRSLARQNSRSRDQLSVLQRENTELAEKLEALTTIERNMNLR
ncbi:hypothetical protein F0A17_12110 [Billgrantia pellis]|uniref:YfhG lipoprotein n=1 Tax=Billgrantia pellis TaxID=2606936 RepID=A0A7V7FZM2_9GAMM|nr:hypothetical protein [Halomonas pellis]KAA0012024.1 hypothetical protein F0A17_12110 [Halomonas pellis]